MWRRCRGQDREGLLNVPMTIFEQYLVPDHSKESIVMSIRVSRKVREQRFELTASWSVSYPASRKRHRRSRVSTRCTARTQVVADCILPLRRDTPCMHHF